MRDRLASTELGQVLPTPAVGLIDALLAVKYLKVRPKGGQELLIKAALVLSVISCSPSALLGDRTIDKALGKHILSAHCVRSSPCYQGLWELGGDVGNSGTESSSKRRSKWCHIESMKRLLIDVNAAQDSSERRLVSLTAVCGRFARLAIWMVMRAH